MSKLFDPRCLELARYFYPDYPEEILAKCAAEIQETVEDFSGGLKWDLEQHRKNRLTASEAIDAIAAARRRGLPPEALMPGRPPEYSTERDRRLTEAERIAALYRDGRVGGNQTAEAMVEWLRAPDKGDAAP